MKALRAVRHSGGVLLGAGSLSARRPNGRLVGVLPAAAIAILFLSACASKPPPAPVTLISCPQPTTEALSAPQPLPRIPALSTDPGEAIGALAVVIASDEAAYQTEADKREALIQHGVERCGWTR